MFLKQSKFLGLSTLALIVIFIGLGWFSGVNSANPAITECRSFDDCCPVGCETTNDIDCLVCNNNGICGDKLGENCLNCANDCLSVCTGLDGVCCPSGMCLEPPFSCNAASCDDEDNCTDDVCNPCSGGCVHYPTPTCPDNDFCEYGEESSADCDGEIYCDDGVDNDQNGYTDCFDGDCALDSYCEECYDSDGDNYGYGACLGPDCNDADPLINPAAGENCTDGVDNDCDGNADCEDSDCIGDPGPTGEICCQSISSCGVCQNCVANSCQSISGDSGQLCDNECTYCNIGVCENRADGDGAECTSPAVCESGSCAVPPPPPCIDDDGDGFGAMACGGTDCDDSNSSVYPGAPEICNDTIDNNCSGYVDCADFGCLGQADNSGNICCGNSSLPPLYLDDSVCGPCHYCYDTNKEGVEYGNVGSNGVNDDIRRCEIQPNAPEGNECTGECTYCVAGVCENRDSLLEAECPACQTCVSGAGGSCQPAHEGVADDVAPNQCLSPDFCASGACSTPPTCTSDSCNGSALLYCPPICVNGTVDPDCDTAGCCGDATCDNPTENCTSCETDCGACPPTCTSDGCNGSFDDCPPICVNGTVDPDCDTAGCCGDGTCDAPSETCNSCETDCSACPDITPPTITITSPTSASTFLTSASTITLGGNASDDTGVTLVEWQRQSPNPTAWASASGTTNWNTSIINLIIGQPNIFSVRAFDAGGNTASDSINVTYNAPYYCDNDGDGRHSGTPGGYSAFGCPGACTGPCQTTPGNDCDDNNEFLFPGNALPCNCSVTPPANEAGSCTDFLDNDCDGLIDCEEVECPAWEVCTGNCETSSGCNPATYQWICVENTSVDCGTCGECSNASGNWNCEENAPACAGVCNVCQPSGIEYNCELDDDLCTEPCTECSGGDCEPIINGLDSGGLAGSLCNSTNAPNTSFNPPHTCAELPCQCNDVGYCVGCDNADLDEFCDDEDPCPYDPSNDFDNDNICAAGCDAGPSRFGSKPNGWLCDTNPAGGYNSVVLYDLCQGANCNTNPAGNCLAIFGARDYFNIYIDGKFLTGNLFLPKYLPYNPPEIIISEFPDTGIGSATNPIPPEGDGIHFNVNDFLDGSNHVVAIEAYDSGYLSREVRGVFVNNSDTGLCTLLNTPNRTEFSPAKIEFPNTCLYIEDGSGTPPPNEWIEAAWSPPGSWGGLNLASGGVSQMSARLYASPYGSLYNNPRGFWKIETKYATSHIYCRYEFNQ